MAKIEALVITAFHKDAYTIINTQRVAVDKANGTMQTKLGALIVSKYGKVAPTYAQFRADRDALKELASDKGLADDQWLRKPFNAAIIAIFGALPEAQTAAALAKRKVRDAEDAKKLETLNKTRKSAGEAPLDKLPKKVAAPAATRPQGAQPGKTLAQPTPVSETIEQLIARVGLWEIMDACARILNADQSTSAEAKLLQPIVRKHLKAA